MIRLNHRANSTLNPPYLLERKLGLILAHIPIQVNNILPEGEQTNYPYLTEEL